MKGWKKTIQPNVSPEQLARLRGEDEHSRPLLESEMPVVREEWRQYVRSLTDVHGEVVNGILV